MNHSQNVEIFVLVYNDAAVATRAIESVLSQTHRHFRLTILENGSSDNSRAVVSRYLKDSRVRLVVNERNIRSVMGATYLMASQAEYLSILFSDDFYEPVRLEVMLSEIGDNAAIFSNNLYANQNGTLVEPPVHIATVPDISLLTVNEHLRQFYTTGNSLHPSAMLVRSGAYRELGGFAGHLHRLGDMVFFTRLLSSRPVRLIPNRLQTVTVWEDLRNESAANVRDPMPTVLESSNFWELYAKDPILSRLGKIFGSHLDHLQFDGDAERLWYLGNRTISLADPWKMNFAFRCLYRALELDAERINHNMLRAAGTTASEYIHHLAETHVPSYRLSVVPRRVITLREYARQFGALRGLYQLAKPLVPDFRKRKVA